MVDLSLGLSAATGARFSNLSKVFKPKSNERYLQA